MICSLTPSLISSPVIISFSLSANVLGPSCCKFSTLLPQALGIYSAFCLVNLYQVVLRRARVASGREAEALRRISGSLGPQIQEWPSNAQSPQKVDWGLASIVLKPQGTGELQLAAGLYYKVVDKSPTLCPSKETFTGDYHKHGGLHMLFL